MTPLSFYPLLEVKEEVRFESDSSEFWRENLKFKKKHSVIV